MLKREYSVILYGIRGVLRARVAALELQSLFSMYQGRVASNAVRSGGPTAVSHSILCQTI